MLDKLLGNDFINHNMQYVLEGYDDITNKVSSNFDNSNIYDVSNFLVNSLCKSVLFKNDYYTIMEIAPGHDYHATQGKLQQLCLLYDEESFSLPSLVQDIATPDCKLYYPEPFIASPSFTHEEI
jgi:hypothetical protein